MKEFSLVTLILCLIGLKTNAQQINVINQKTENQRIRFVKNDFKQFDNTGFADIANDYLTKSRKQRTAAKILTGTGSALLATGIIIAVNNAGNKFYDLITLDIKERKTTTEIIFIIVGGAALIGSIPLYIAAKKNGQKAKLSVSNQGTAFGVPANVSKFITGLTLTISAAN